jgi:hypothetical protein
MIMIGRRTASVVSSRVSTRQQEVGPRSELSLENVKM